MGVDPTGLACYCGTPRDDKLAEAGRQVGVGVAQSETKVDDAILVGALAVMAAPVAIEVGAAVLANPVATTRALAELAEAAAPGAGSGTLAAAGAVGTAAVGKLVGAADSAVVSSSKIAGLAGDLESHLGTGFRKIESPTGNSIFRSADGTKQVRFDLNDYHGDPNGPHINLETWAPRNLYPGDTRMQQIENLHIYPKGP